MEQHRNNQLINKLLPVPVIKFQCRKVSGNAAQTAQDAEPNTRISFSQLAQCIPRMAPRSKAANNGYAIGTRHSTRYAHSLMTSLSPPVIQFLSSLHWIQWPYLLTWFSQEWNHYSFCNFIMTLGHVYKCRGSASFWCTWWVSTAANVEVTKNCPKGQMAAC